jgi:O-succinylbenzoic acid--CoA ligase
VRELIAIDLPPGPDFVIALNEIWNNGDAVLPIDQRLPRVARQEMLKQLKAKEVITSNNERLHLDNSQPVEDGDALIIATSGSTGTPKGVVHTHESINSAIQITGARLNCSSDDHWLACLSLAHVGGLSVVLRAMSYKSKLSFVDHIDQDSINMALKSGATMTSLVPTVLQSVDVRQFRTVLIGGAQAPGVMPPNVVTTYGLTETMGGVIYNEVPLDQVEIRISAETEIQIKSPTLFRCYRDGTDTKITSGWFNTGDLGELVGGKLKVHGRKDELINTGGYKVWPSSVADVIREIDQVSDVIVAGTPDDKWGSAVTAWIVLKKPATTLKFEDVRQHVKTTLPDYCAPQKIYIVAEIPRSALGKPKFVELNKMVTTQLS